MTLGLHLAALGGSTLVATAVGAALAHALGILADLDSVPPTPRVADAGAEQPTTLALLLIPPLLAGVRRGWPWACEREQDRHHADAPL